MRAHLDGSAASTTALRFDLPLGRKPLFSEMLKSLVYNINSNMIRTHTYAHPHHMTVMKHLIWFMLMLAPT